jgi:c-di-GMP-binding flagellar brake protein YcgR
LESDVFDRAASLWNRLTQKPAWQGPGAGQTAEEDRRLQVRRHVRVETKVTPAAAEAEPSLSARILDVSSGGVKLVVGRAFEQGDLLTLELPAPAGGPAVSVLACVVHAQREGDEEWVLGCRFSAELNDADLAAFGAVRAKPVEPDGRNWSRFPCEVKAVYQIIPDEDDVRREAKVLNISAGGVAMLVEHEVRAGALLSAELHAPTGQTVVTILACVVHVSVQSEHERVLGCNFIQELSENDLKALA